MYSAMKNKKYVKSLDDGWIRSKLELIKGGEANFSFRDFKPDFLHQYLLKS